MHSLLSLATGLKAAPAPRRAAGNDRQEATSSVPEGRRESQKLAAAWPRTFTLSLSSNLPHCVGCVEAARQDRVPSSSPPRLRPTRAAAPAARQLHLPQRIASPPSAAGHNLFLARPFPNHKHKALQAEEVALEKCPRARDATSHHGFHHAPRPREGRRQSNVCFLSLHPIQPPPLVPLGPHLRDASQGEVAACLIL